MHRSSLIALLLVVSVCLPTVKFMPQPLGYAVVLIVLVTAVAAIATVRDDRIRVRVQPVMFFLFVILWTLFIVELVRYPKMSALKRAPVFIGVSAIAVFVLPAVIDRHAVERALAWVGGVAVLLAVPAVVVGPVMVGTQPILAGGQRIFGELYVATSLFTNPNQLAILTLFGVLGGVSAARNADRSHHRIGFLVLAGICMVGLVLTDGRAAWLAFACTSSLAVIFRFGRRRALTIAVATLALATVVGVIAAIGDRDLGLRLGINERYLIWNATVDAIRARPLSGWGFTNPYEILSPALPADVATSIHNSYLRIFFITGISGGFAYLALTTVAGWLALRQTDEAGLSLILFVVAVGIIQVFEGGTIFGASLFSVVGALWYGYAQPPTSERMIQVPMNVQRKVTSALDRLRI